MMRTSEMPTGAFILKDRKQALQRYHAERRDVWAVYTSDAMSAKPVWVETGPMTSTDASRRKARDIAVEVVQTRTGKTATHVDYDP